LAQSTAAADWAWPGRQSNPEQFLKHTLARHLLTLQSEGGCKAEMEAENAGEVAGPGDTAC
jgi:hypothetical protein